MSKKGKFQKLVEKLSVQYDMNEIEIRDIINSMGKHTKRKDYIESAKLLKDPKTFAETVANYSASLWKQNTTKPIGLVFEEPISYCGQNAQEKFDTPKDWSIFNNLNDTAQELVYAFAEFLYEKGSKK